MLKNTVILSALIYSVQLFATSTNNADLMAQIRQEALQLITKTKPDLTAAVAASNTALPVKLTDCPTLYRLVQDCATVAGMQPPIINVSTDQRTRQRANQWSIYFDRERQTVYIGQQLLTTLKFEQLAAILMYQLHDRFVQSSTRWAAQDQFGYFLTSIGSILMTILAAAGIISFFIGPVGLIITFYFPFYPVLVIGLTATAVGLAHASARLEQPVDTAECFTNPDHLEQALDAITLMAQAVTGKTRDRALRSQQVNMRKYIAYMRQVVTPVPTKTPATPTLEFKQTIA